MRADARRNREKILAAAAELVAERGQAASTEDIAIRAGVAAGTVFRHFPTKNDLLTALMKDLAAQLMTQAHTLADDPDGLFLFFTALVERAAGQRTVVELLGIDAGPALEPFRQALAALLARGQAAGRVRPDVTADEVFALLTLATQSVLHTHWDDALRTRTVTLITDGLRP